MSKTKLKIDLISGLIYVDVSLWSIDDNRYGKTFLLFDTGASVTTIGDDIIERLGYTCSPNKKARITTASGVEYVHSIAISKMKLGNIELNDTEIYAHKFPESSFSKGVIGMNVISKFKITIDLDEKIIELEERIL